MYFGIVRGTVVATIKEPLLSGHKLLLVQPVTDQKTPVGMLEVAVDTVQAGEGDFVMLVGSKEASMALTPHGSAVDAAIIGIIDAATRDVQP